MLADRLTAPTELGPDIVAGDPQILHQAPPQIPGQAIAGNGAGARVPRSLGDRYSISGLLAAGSGASYESF